MYKLKAGTTIVQNLTLIIIEVKESKNFLKGANTKFLQFQQVEATTESTFHAHEKFNAKQLKLKSLKVHDLFYIQACRN